MNQDNKFKVNYDFFDGKFSKELLIVGVNGSRYNSFIIYEYEDYDDIKEEGAEISDFCEVFGLFH